METWIWIASFFLLLWAPYRIVRNMGQRALSRHLSEKDGQDFSEWWLLATETRKRKAKELADWDKDFQAILRRTCTHRFEPNRWDDWWKCLDCAYEPEWKYSGGCSCRVVHDRSIAGQPFIALTERNRFCPQHGRELYVLRAQETKRVRSKGSYPGHSTDNLSAAVKRLQNVIDDVD